MNPYREGARRDSSSSSLASSPPRSSQPIISPFSPLPSSTKARAGPENSSSNAVPTPDPVAFRRGLGYALTEKKRVVTQRDNNSEERSLTRRRSTSMINRERREGEGGKSEKRNSMNISSLTSADVIVSPSPSSTSPSTPPLGWRMSEEGRGMSTALGSRIVEKERVSMGSEGLVAPSTSTSGPSSPSSLFTNRDEGERGGSKEEEGLNGSNASSSYYRFDGK